MGTETQSGAEALLRELERKKQKELSSIEEEFKKKAEELERQARAEIQSIQRKAEAESAIRAQSETNRIIGAARLEAKRLLFDAMEKMMSSNVQRLNELLKSYVESESYRKLLLRMAKYASSRLGKGMLVSCRAEDKQLLNSNGYKTVDNDLQCLGGIKAYDASKTLELDLTFEELLRMKDEQIRSAIMEKIG
ncbi:MAG: V-type ATP synthase subunit E [Conexivisphaerales archaeon]